MCAPLGIGKKLRGLLYVDNLSRRGMFTVDDLNAFAVIAVQAGLAINRVRTRKDTFEPVRS
jgi:GAF domain-containing protein